MADNDFIAERLERLGNLLEILGENQFKVAAYYKAARTIEGLETSVADLDRDNKLGDIPGVGDALKSKISDIVRTGTCPKLVEVEAAVPEGVIDMLRIRGLGPKKIQQIWKELDITSVGDLLYACNENRLVQAKGFGEKTQEKLRNSIEFLHKNQNLFHYATLYPIAQEFLTEARKTLGSEINLSLTGDIRRKMPELARLDVLSDGNVEYRKSIVQWLADHSVYQLVEQEGDEWKINLTGTRIFIHVHFASGSFPLALFRTTGNEAHVAAVAPEEKDWKDEAEIYAAAGMDFIEPELRENRGELELAKAKKLPKLIEFADIKGMIHNHSTWSDGIHSLAQMATACRDNGWEYLCISDHSKSAFYANGLSETRIAMQHKEIDSLNQSMAPFHIFKGIESDILNDGSLDYADDVLATFDCVIASVHSQLSMTEEKANARLIKAIENPFTNMLGHPTGRLLLMRAGYPIDHKKIIDACSANGVMIEINANPWRLDIDWKWVGYALEKGVMLSVNPDAHKMEGYADTFWGIEAGRKGMLTAEMTLNCKSKDEVAEIFRNKRRKL